MSDETPREDEQPDDAGAGEPGREDVAGARDGQPGYDLDEGAAYEQEEEGSD